MFIQHWHNTKACSVVCPNAAFSENDIYFLDRLIYTRPKIQGRGLTWPSLSKAAGVDLWMSRQVCSNSRVKNERFQDKVEKPRPGIARFLFDAVLGRPSWCTDCVVASA